MAFGEDLRAALDDMGLWSGDPAHDSGTVAAIDAAAGAALSAWLNQLQTFASGMDPVSRLGAFGQALTAGQLATALQGLPNALAAAHAVLDAEHFERAVQLGAVALKYVDFQLEVAGIDREDAEAFDAGFRHCMQHLGEQTLLQTDPPAGLAVFVDGLSPETFVDALFLELQEQTIAAGMDIFT